MTCKFELQSRLLARCRFPWSKNMLLLDQSHNHKHCITYINMLLLDHSHNHKHLWLWLWNCLHFNCHFYLAVVCWHLTSQLSVEIDTFIWWTFNCDFWVKPAWVWTGNFSWTASKIRSHIYKHSFLWLIYYFCVTLGQIHNCEHW